ncbi:MAG: LacI family transcriptional regulator [Ancrocorticia sp.]|jgi:DNA-binding LacI/PurR family transcriptional regulator|nr:LacI family transcriptional regulator [Ancrocorticia sp.]MCI2003007.1 LacI family transcriptional regulator [Ancrocorticia sp.]MCI2179305.1 LacI family transcriptional regulator [Ancrocorticia sp.]MCI2193678.1 LacI family transcriptional regulator [Ancrocorticia sp.]
MRATHRATISDVAQRAGVSRQTVSNAINSPDAVRPETRQRVEAAIEELQYRPNASARRLRTQRPATIAIRVERVSNGISGTVYDTFLHALTVHAAERDRRILLFAAQNVDEEIQQYRSLSYGDDVDAFVITGTSHDDTRIAWLVRHRIRFVSFGRPWSLADLDDPRVPWVDVDGRAGVRAATEHYLKQGLRNVAWIGWPSRSGTGDDRRCGWEDAMAAAGVPESQREALSISAPEGISTGAAALREVQQRLGANGVDGVVCASDSLALGAHLGCGGTLPITGFDNTPVAASQGISSIAQPIEAVAAKVLDLLEPDGSSAESNHVLFTPSLVSRSEPELG